MAKEKYRHAVQKMNNISIKSATANKPLHFQFVFVTVKYSKNRNWNYNWSLFETLAFKKLGPA